MKHRSFLKEIDFQPVELRYLLRLAESLRLAKYAGTEVKHLDGNEIAPIFEKTSTRTRAAFEVAAYDQGAHVTYLDPSGSQLGHKESVVGWVLYVEHFINKDRAAGAGGQAPARPAHAGVR